MRRIHVSNWARVGLASAVFLGMAAVLLTPPAGAAQQKDPIPVKLRFKYDLKEDLTTIRERQPLVLLRPNVPRTVYLFVENESPDRILNVTAKLLKIEADGTATPLKQVQIDSLEGKELRQIVFGGPAEKKDEKNDKKNGDPGLPLAGPPFEFLVIFEQNQYSPREEILSARIMQPQEYVDVVETRYTPETLSLFVGVKVKEAVKVPDKLYIIGTPCVVNLVLLPELVPGLLPIKTKGTYKQVISVQSAKPSALKAEDLQFTGTPPDNSRVYLTVDGYERAFMLLNSFTPGQPVLAKPEPRLRVWMPRVAAPSPKLPVKVEADFVQELDPPRTNRTKPRPVPVLLRVGWWEEGEPFVPIKELAGDRQQLITFDDSGPGGGILLKNFTKDWELEIDATDLFGERILRAELLDPKAKANVLLVAEQKDPAERIVPLLESSVGSPFAWLDYEYNGGDRPLAVKAAITLDSTPPDIHLAFNLENKKTHVKGTPVLVKARVTDPEPVTPIKDVVFFLGKPTPKGTIPENVQTIAGENDPKDPSVWLVRLPIATDKAGLFDISVQATNQAGLSQTKTITLILVDPGQNGKDGDEGPKVAKITGKVVVGALAQKDVPVTLADPKGEVKATTATKDGGVFVFEKVPPGPYLISAANPALKLTGQAQVTVPPGVAEVKDVVIPLKR